MAYPKLVEGNRVYTAVANSNVKAADVNEHQDQELAIFQSRYIDLMPFGIIENGSSWETYYNASPAEWGWRNLTASSHRMAFGVPMREGQKILRAEMMVAGDANGGHIKLLRAPQMSGSSAGFPSGSAYVTVEDLGGANPFNPATAGHDYQRLSHTFGTPHVIAKDHVYIVEVLHNADNVVGAGIQAMGLYAPLGN